jgi:hypothetical protein
LRLHPPLLAVLQGRKPSATFFSLHPNIASLLAVARTLFLGYLGRLLTSPSSVMTCAVMTRLTRKSLDSMTTSLALSVNQPGRSGLRRWSLGTSSPTRLPTGHSLRSYPVRNPFNPRINPSVSATELSPNLRPLLGGSTSSTLLLGFTGQIRKLV